MMGSIRRALEQANALELTRTRGYEEANHAKKLLADAHAPPIYKRVARVGCSEWLARFI